MLPFHPSCPSVRCLGSGAHVAVPTPPVAPQRSRQGGGGLRYLPYSPGARTKESAEIRGAETRGEEGSGGEGCCQENPGLAPGALRGRRLELPLSRRDCSEAQRKTPSGAGMMQDELRDRQTDGPALALASSPHTLMRQGATAARVPIKRRRRAGGGLRPRAGSPRHPLLVKMCRNGALPMDCCCVWEGKS